MRALQDECQIIIGKEFEFDINEPMFLFSF